MASFSPPHRVVCPSQMQRASESDDGSRAGEEANVMLDEGDGEDCHVSPKSGAADPDREWLALLNKMAALPLPERELIMQKLYAETASVDHVSVAPSSSRDAAAESEVAAVAAGALAPSVLDAEETRTWLRAFHQKPESATSLELDELEEDLLAIDKLQQALRSFTSEYGARLRATYTQREWWPFLQLLARLADVYAPTLLAHAAVLWSYIVRCSHAQRLTVPDSAALQQLQQHCRVRLLPQPADVDRTTRYSKQLRAARCWLKQLPCIRDDVEPSPEQLQNILGEVQIRIVALFRGMLDDALADLAAEGLHCPVRFAALGLGSLARMETTFWSDVEWAILIEDAAPDTRRQARQFFVRLCNLLLLRVVQLGETIVPSMGIPVLNPVGDDWFHDNVSPRGFCFDGLMGHACKWPLGRSRLLHPTEVSFCLIQTPERMASLHTDATVQRLGLKLSSVLSNTVLLKGDQSLLDEYRRHTDAVMQTLKRKTVSWFAVLLSSHGLRGVDTLVEAERRGLMHISLSNERALAELGRMVDAFTQERHSDMQGFRYVGKALHLKRKCYRLPSVVLDCLFRITHRQGEPSGHAAPGSNFMQKLRHLQQQQSALSEVGMLKYLEVFGRVCLYRLRVYARFDRQQDDLHDMPQHEVACMEASVCSMLEPLVKVLPAFIEMFGMACFPVPDLSSCSQQLAATQSTAAAPRARAHKRLSANELQQAQRSLSTLFGMQFLPDGSSVHGHALNTTSFQSRGVSLFVEAEALLRAQMLPEARDKHLALWNIEAESLASNQRVAIAANLGYIFGELGDFEEAYKWHSQEATLVRDCGANVQFDSYMNLACAARQAGRLDDSKRLYAELEERLSTVDGAQQVSWRCQLFINRATGAMLDRRFEADRSLVLQWARRGVELAIGDAAHWYPHAATVLTGLLFEQHALCEANAVVIQAKLAVQRLLSSDGRTRTASRLEEQLSIFEPKISWTCAARDGFVCSIAGRSRESVLKLKSWNFCVRVPHGVGQAQLNFLELWLRRQDDDAACDQIDNATLILTLQTRSIITFIGMQDEAEAFRREHAMPASQQ